MAAPSNNRPDDASQRAFAERGAKIKEILALRETEAGANTRPVSGARCRTCLKRVATDVYKTPIPEPIVINGSNNRGSIDLVCVPSCSLTMCSNCRIMLTSHRCGSCGFHSMEDDLPLLYGLIGTDVVRIHQRCAFCSWCGQDIILCGVGASKWVAEAALADLHCAAELPTWAASTGGPVGALFHECCANRMRTHACMDTKCGDACQRCEAAREIAALSLVDSPTGGLSALPNTLLSLIMEATVVSGPIAID